MRHERPQTSSLRRRLKTPRKEGSQRKKERERKRATARTGASAGERDRERERVAKREDQTPQHTHSNAVN